MHVQRQPVKNSEVLKYLQATQIILQSYNSVELTCWLCEHVSSV